MIPDKIYLPKSLKAQGINRYCDWEEVEIPGYDNICYIRKEALLEWANKELKDNVGQYHNDYDLALSSLIDKLNEM